MSDKTGKRGTFKDQTIVLLYSIVLGLICGIIMWVFMWLMEYGIEFIWGYLPNIILGNEVGPYEMMIYIMSACLIGAVIIGLIHKKFGDYPEEMSVVFSKIKRDGSYDYTKVPIYALTAFVPLILGASIGPEAGLVGLVAGLCSFVKHKFKVLGKQFSDVANVGFAAALAVVFQNPLFGFIEPIEDDDFNIPKKSKIILYFTVILSAFGIFMILSYLFPTPGEGITQLTDYFAGKKEWLLALPCMIIGYAGGFIFLFFQKYIPKAYGRLGDRPMVKALIGGLILGLCGILLPYTMFSGESQIGYLSIDYREMGAVLLIVTCLIKLFLTVSCISSGFKGGHFFPAIFAGISLGYGMSMLLDINPTFCCAAITAALIASTLRKPVATALLMLLCFPLDSILVLLIASVIGSFLPMPKPFITSDIDVDPNSADPLGLNPGSGSDSDQN